MKTPRMPRHSILNDDVSYPTPSSAVYSSRDGKEAGNATCFKATVVFYDVYDMEPISSVEIKCFLRRRRSMFPGLTKYRAWYRIRTWADRRLEAYDASVAMINGLEEI